MFFHFRFDFRAGGAVDGAPQGFQVMGLPQSLVDLYADPEDAFIRSTVDDFAEQE
jgi:hypothetical protein